MRRFAYEVDFVIYKRTGLQVVFCVQPFNEIKREIYRTLDGRATNVVLGETETESQKIFAKDLQDVYSADSVDDSSMCPALEFSGNTTHLQWPNLNTVP
jgi:hypothetical protein